MIDRKRLRELALAHRHFITDSALGNVVAAGDGLLAAEFSCLDHDEIILALLDALEAPTDDARDAARRYEWLRAACHDNGCVDIYIKHEGCDWESAPQIKSGAHLDAAIDAAERTKEQG